MPQVYLIVSHRGIELGYAAAIHYQDFSNPAFKNKVKLAAPTIYDALPDPDSDLSRTIAEKLTRQGGWFFRKKARLDPQQPDFANFADWLRFFKSVQGKCATGGTIARYWLPHELTGDTDLMSQFLGAAQTFDDLLIEPRKAIEPANPSRTSGMPGRSDDEIGQGLEHFMEVYPESRTRAFGIDPQLWGILQDLQERLKTLPVLLAHPTIRVTWSVGKGNWARVPWIGLLDSQLTTTTESGVYIVFLFREDMSGVYVTLAQGITEPKKEHGAAAGLQIVRERAAAIRATCENLTPHGFQLDLDIDLHTEGWRGLDYQASVIAYKLYERGKVPSDAVIAEDLKALVTAYDQHIASQSDAGTPDEDVEALPIAAPPYSLSDALANSSWKKRS